MISLIASKVHPFHLEISPSHTETLLKDYKEPLINPEISLNASELSSNDSGILCFNYSVFDSMYWIIT